mmetsp:Transcript_111348/g.218229  ORF Transcript_111348/g.218229 Transcript_111348/m.218229 type:complete len:226 (+) Transcript_111348:146-823(+)
MEILAPEPERAGGDLVPAGHIRPHEARGQDQCREVFPEPGPRHRHVRGRRQRLRRLARRARRLGPLRRRSLDGLSVLLGARRQVVDDGRRLDPRGAGMPLHKHGHLPVLHRVFLHADHDPNDPLDLRGRGLGRIRVAHDGRRHWHGHGVDDDPVQAHQIPLQLPAHCDTARPAHDHRHRLPLRVLDRHIDGLRGASLEDRVVCEVEPDHRHSLARVVVDAPGRHL